ncbi:MAG: ATP-binding cassette domain-containing protein [Desulfobacteraceae bacterium]|nr:ATP-binding cassette domain-containing protein [Desulfobacteraceae bacterium]
MSSGLELRDFSCRAVHNLQLEVVAGQSLGITGPSGTGKSLFLRAVADLEPYEGSMFLDGMEANHMPAPQWRRQVGLLPAESAWWFDTVGEHFGQRAPDGLEQLGFGPQTLGWQINHLSSGERQRLALLRLLVHQPRVLLLDEPTANLDSENTERVESLLSQYRETHRPAILWVSHDLGQLKRWCHPILTLKDHHLVEAQPTHSAISSAGPEKAP